ITLDFIFNAYRQGLAFLFVALSLSYFSKNRKKISLLMFIIGLGFHWSSIIVAMAVLARRFISLRLAIRLNVIILVLTLVAAIVPLKIIPFISSVLLLGSFGSPYVLKITHYLDSPIAYFYDLNMLGRMPLIMTVIATLTYIYIYRRVIPVFYYKLVIILMLYCLLFLEMSYSFRNYYWVLPVLPLIMANTPAFLKGNNEKKSALFLALLFHIILSITGYYTSGIMPMIFA
ncbi:EpsG family protein, partial [Enterobacter hormaechei]